MKILLILESAGTGGSARHVLDLSQALQDKGHQVHLIYSKGRSDEWFEGELSRLANVVKCPLPMSTGISLGDIKTVFDIFLYTQKHGPFDIVHGHSSKGGAFARLLPPLRGRPSRIYTPHAFFTMNPRIGSFKRALYSFLERRLDQLSGSAVIAVSERERSHALSLGIPSRKIRVIVNGVNSDPAAPAKRAAVRKRFGIAANEVCIGYVGRFSNQKAPEITANAFKNISHVNKNTKLLMVGAGELAVHCAEILREQIDSGRAHMITGEQGKDIMPAFDIFASSSRYEAMAYVFLEAASLLIPIVCTDVAGSEMVVTPGVNGYIAKPDDLQSFEDALQKGLDLVTTGPGTAANSGIPNVAKMTAQTETVYLSSWSGSRE